MNIKYEDIYYKSAQIVFWSKKLKELILTILDDLVYAALDDFPEYSLHFIGPLSLFEDAFELIPEISEAMAIEVISAAINIIKVFMFQYTVDDKHVGRTKLVWLG